LNKKSLLEYEARELAENNKLLKEIDSDIFHVEEDKYPRDERYPKIQYPTARIPFGRTSSLNSIYPQIPFCGSLIIQIPPLPKQTFEAEFGSLTEIPRIVDFAKDTGKIQFEIIAPPTYYEDLDFLDPIFLELNPPYACGIPTEVFFSQREFTQFTKCFFSLAHLGFLGWLKKQPIVLQAGKDGLILTLLNMEVTYAFLKHNKHPLAEEIENQLIDNYGNAFSLLLLSRIFITDRIRSMRHDSLNFSLEDLKLQDALTMGSKISPINFPYEIGKFLMTKLTYAPLSLDACKELIYHYEAYDLRKVQQALNEAIINTKPDLLKEKSDALSEILDNIWNDKTLERKIKAIQTGLPLSMAAIGSVAAGPIGAAGGFLAGLGYNVLDKTIDLGTNGFSERLAKISSKSYQVNIFDFKKKISRSHKIKKGFGCSL
jgi:hypothetical protein